MMAQPDRNPFEPPRSEVLEELPSLDVFGWRRWALVGFLSLQLFFGVLATLVGEYRVVALAVSILLNVAPPAAAIWNLLRRKPIGIALSLVSASLMQNLSSGVSASFAKLFVMLLALAMLGLTASLAWSYRQSVRAQAR
jgi:hypothetical protein